MFAELVPRYLVATHSGVKGIYTDIEEAKKKLNSMQSGSRVSRLIAEVNEFGKLMRDPHIVGGQNQGIAMGAGFDKWWGDWNDINKLMDICEEFLR